MKFMGAFFAEADLIKKRMVFHIGGKFIEL